MLNKLLGARGEKKAAKYLNKKGYRIIETNYRTPYGEVDLVASRDNTLIFVEVKLRSSGRFGSGTDAVTSRKQQKIIKCAYHYCQQNNLQSLCRFDIISIDGDEITHIENAFGA